MYSLQTEVGLPPSPERRLKYGDAVLSLGSCFSEHIGRYLTEQGHRVEVNPFGALYNPLSILQALDRLLEGEPFTEAELFEYDGLWHSSMHHGAYSSADPERTLELINADYTRAAQALPRLKYLLLTWGTAYVYEERSTGRVVTNCHKRPEREFVRRRLSADELTTRLLPRLKDLLDRCPELTIISTVSPIRHLRDGAHDNQLSKATLLMMDEALGTALGSRYHYFPAYEIVQDELRDYRFYAEDMTHPAELTIRIIRERLAEWLLSDEAQALGTEVDRLRRQWTHRPLHPDHPEYDLRRSQLETVIRALIVRHPEVDIRSWFDLD